MTSPSASTACAPASRTVEPERVRLLNAEPVRAERGYVLYWMQASVRALLNHALEYAAERARALRRPLVACFGVTDDYPEANLRHYAFLLEGLRDVQRELAERRGVRLLVLRGRPDAVAAQCGRGACEVVTDMGYLRVQRAWRTTLAAALDCRLTQVESESVVPVELASDKHEFAARTLRPRLWRHLERFCVPIEGDEALEGARGARASRARAGAADAPVDAGPFETLELDDVDAALASMRNIDRSVTRVSEFYAGGTSEALHTLRTFCAERLPHYASRRSDPSACAVSNLSPYLHFGHISPITAAITAWQTADAPRAARDSFIEELVVRRELSFNHCWYAPDDYDSLDSLPDWVHRTRREHARDERTQQLYTREQMERGATHDEYWNAAQREMVLTGKMHNYMRMYWGKCIVQWTPDWRTAYDVAIYLNNKYELDGRDANSFVGVLWCFGLHDRAHAERPVLGKLRYISRDGLRRKFGMHAYLAMVEALERGATLAEAEAAAAAAAAATTKTKTAVATNTGRKAAATSKARRQTVGASGTEPKRNEKRQQQRRQRGMGSSRRKE